MQNGHINHSPSLLGAKAGPRDSFRKGGRHSFRLNAIPGQVLEGLDAFPEESLHVFDLTVYYLVRALRGQFDSFVSTTKEMAERMRVTRDDGLTEFLPCRFHALGWSCEFEVIHVKHQKGFQLGIPVATFPILYLLEPSFSQLFMCLLFPIGPRLGMSVKR